MKKVIVFGGSGFIGSHVVKNLLGKGYSVTIADRLTSMDRFKSKEYSNNQLLKIILMDIKDRGMVSDLMFAHDYGINLAGLLGTSETVDDPYPSVEANIFGALNFLEGCRKHNKPGVQITVGNHFMNNSYAISKTTAERFALMYNKEHGTKVAIVRGLNAYGPGQKHKPVRKIMPNFVTRALRKEPIKIFGSGNQIMDMIWVKDLAEILVRAAVMEHGVYDKIFEAGVGIPTTVNNIADIVNKHAKNPSGVEHIQMRAGETKDSVVLGDPETLRPLGFTNKDFMSLDTGVKKTVKWYKENYEWQRD